MAIVKLGNSLITMVTFVSSGPLAPIMPCYCYFLQHEEQNTAQINTYHHSGDNIVGFFTIVEKYIGYNCSGGSRGWGSICNITF